MTLNTTNDFLLKFIWKTMEGETTMIPTQIRCIWLKDSMKDYKGLRNYKKEVYDKVDKWVDT